MNYNVYIPSGNPTALVIGIVEDPIKRKEINDEIINTYNGLVEHVGFVNEDKNTPQLLMAGGEFCGNATRSAIYYYLDGKDGLIDIEILGVNLRLQGGITNNTTWVNMPIQDDCISKGIDNSTIVRIPGITHVIVELNESNINDLEEYSKYLLNNNNLMNELAAGVMYIERINNKIKLTPYVYVKEVNTWFKETACGSGTTAVGLNESYLTNKSVDLDIIQPSNEIINIKTILENNKIIKATISGIVKIYK